MHAYRSSQGRRNLELQYSYVVSKNQCQQETFNLTCIVISKTVSGAGLTSVMSCAAADVMSDPADWMAGCMRGASDSRVNVEFGEGKVKELAETTASICSTDDCMMLTRAFSSARTPGSALQKRTLSDTSTIKYTRENYPVAAFWVDATDCEK
jgi:hypothetical protein